MSTERLSSVSQFTLATGTILSSEGCTQLPRSAAHRQVSFRRDPLTAHLSVCCDVSIVAATARTVQRHSTSAANGLARMTVPP